VGAHYKRRKILSTAFVVKGRFRANEFQAQLFRHQLVALQISIGK
jgi:hypothetical protein